MEQVPYCCNNQVSKSAKLLKSKSATLKSSTTTNGDVVRTHLSKELSFSKEDRDTNIRRIAFVANLLSRNGVIAIVAAISPYRSLRDEIRHSTNNFMEVYINAPIEVCEERDVKGLYAKARSGEILNFTGISDPYEAPISPELICHTDVETVHESIDKVLAEVLGRVKRLGSIHFRK